MYTIQTHRGGVRVAKLPTTTKSKKAKGRRLQNWVRDLIGEWWGIDTKTRLMGEAGDDVYVENVKWPLYIECKNCENLNVHKEFAKAKVYAKASSKHNSVKIPVLIWKKNDHLPLVILDVFVFLEVFKNGNPDLQSLMLLPPK